MGAIFPECDWVFVDDKRFKFIFSQEVKRISDSLMLKYRIIGDDQRALTRLLMPTTRRFKGDEPLASAVGCVCISWTRHKVRGKRVYIPVLGFSGVTEAKPDPTLFQKYCRHLALPTNLALVSPQVYQDDKLTDFAFAPHPEIKSKQVEKSKKSQIILPLVQKKKRIDDKLRQKQKNESEQKKKESEQEKEGLIAEEKEEPTIEETLDEEEKIKLGLWLEEKTQLESEISTLIKEDVKLKEWFDVENELAVNYETMVRRTNLCALSYRTRQVLGLRLPSRQALMSYVAFRESKGQGVPLSINEDYKERLDELGWKGLAGLDLWICGWHTLNCAEPSALATASSFFCSGTDVEICFPYEGLLDTGGFCNRPKETCPWCAAVELGFRSVSKPKPMTNLSSSGTFILTEQIDESLKTGEWDTQPTHHLPNEPSDVLGTGDFFDAFASENEIMSQTKSTLGGCGLSLARNKDLELAYSEVIHTKIGRIRSLFHLMGLIDQEIVALDRPLFVFDENGDLFL